MTKQQRDTVDQALGNAPFDLGGDVETQRPLLEHLLTEHPLPADVLATRGELGGVPVMFVEIADSDPAGTLFHLHGGGFALGSANGSVSLVSDLARRSNSRAVTVDYRLAPKNPYPAASDDVIAAYRALVERDGASGHVVVTGESAGGNLAVALLVAAKNVALPLPAAAILMSPMTDLTASGESFTTKAGIDPNITAAAITTRARDYLGDHDPADPAVSPLFADLTGLPPLLIQAGSHESLLDDATRLAAKAATDDVATILDITPGVPHVFQAFAAILDEGDAALDRAAAFIRAHAQQKAAA